MDAAYLIRTCRAKAGYSLRELAALAETSHATLSAYERGRVTPGVDTVARIADACGFAIDPVLSMRRRDGFGGTRRGDELAAALELAAEFPSRHAKALQYPRFARL